MHHQSQRIDIYAGIIRLGAVNLWRHIAIGTCLGGLSCLLSHSGNAEISQLEVTIAANKDILRFDIPVNDLIFLTELQSLANVDAEANYNILSDLVCLKISPIVIRQRCQKLHTNQDVPARILLMSLHAVILIAHNVAVSLHLRHELEFPRDLLYLALVICRNADIIHTIIPLGGDLSGGGRNGDHLQGSVLFLPQRICPHNFVDCSKAAFA